MCHRKTLTIHATVLLTAYMLATTGYADTLKTQKAINEAAAIAASAPSRSRMQVEGSTLVGLATKYFASEGLPLPLTRAELRLLLSAPGPRMAYAGREPDPGKPNSDPLKDTDYDTLHFGKWPEIPQRVIHEELIRWLLTDTEARKHVHPTGVGVAGAIIEALDLSFMEVTVPLFLRNCVLEEGADLEYARMAELDLRGSLVEPSLDLTNTQIGGDLILDNANFFRNAENEDVISAIELMVKGDVLVQNDFVSDGILNFNGAKIDGRLLITNAEFLDNEEAVKRGKEDDDLNGFEGVDMTVGKQFEWLGVTNHEHTELIMDDAKVGTLLDNIPDWPKRHSLGGFVYDNFSQRERSQGRATKARLVWIRSQTSFSTQPYQQLADLFSRLGDQDAATEVLIAKEEDMRSNGGLGWEGHVGKYILGPIIGYGYQPFRAVWPIIGFVVLGALLFSWGYSARVVSPLEAESFRIFTTTGSVPENLQPFNPFVYSVETFLPLVKLGQGEHWVPNANLAPSRSIRRFGRFSRGDHTFGQNFGKHLHWYMWLHISMGWLLTGLLAAGMAGLVHRG